MKVMEAKIESWRGKARDVLSLPLLAVIEVRREYHVPCHCPKSIMDYI